MGEETGSDKTGVPIHDTRASHSVLALPLIPLELGAKLWAVCSWKHRRPSSYYWMALICSVLLFGFILVDSICSHCGVDELGGKTSHTLPLYFNLPNEVTACPEIFSKMSK